jgi:hypothetical protein
MKAVKLTIVCKKTSLLMFFVFNLVLSTYGCDNRSTEGGKAQSSNAKQKNTQPAGPLPSGASITLKITSIDDSPLERGKTPQVGLRVSVEGTVSDEKAIVCVAVHPMSGDTWWIQSLPSPPDKIENAYRWRTTALCGTTELGRNEDFEIVAVAEQARDLCQAGKQFKAEEFPNGLVRSEIIKVKRTKD